MAEVSVRTSDRVVEQIGTSLGQRDGCANENIDAATEQAIRDALAQPNGGVTLSEDHATVTALPAASAPARVDHSAELARAITAVDTSLILDVPTKRAIDALKAALLGEVRPGRVAGRPV